jgi:UDP-N-acetylglucosamine diphosphorylase/glucosamine-1-phosphate N-acetyltransferase
MNYILFDEPSIRVSLMPLTFTRPVALMRVGIFTIAEKWERYLKVKPSFLTDAYLQEKFPLVPSKDNYVINGAVLPTKDLLDEIHKLENEQTLVQGDIILAFKEKASEKYVPYHGKLTIIKNPWDIFTENGAQIRADLELLKAERTWHKITDKYTVIYNPENVFVEENVKIRAAVLNAEDGPIYIGKDTEINEGATIRGPFAVCEHSIIGMQSKMRPDTTIGPFSKVAGEISNSVIFGYSNKGHEPPLGSSVVGEWCNLGADTNNSNLKNNYSNVHLYSYKERKAVNTGRQFCGLIMGDHAKTGINTMFNTGTVVGVCANVFGAGFPDKFIPSFSWGGADGVVVYKIDKAIEVAEQVMARRKMVLSDVDRSILSSIFQMDKPA